MQFLFVEKDPAYYRHLREKVAETPWPSEFDVDIKPGEFEPALTALLDDVAAGQRKMPPTLLFIDPFGSSGFSMELLERLAAFARIDVLINLNHAAFVQWILPDEAKHVTADRLYGGPRWRPALRMGGQERADFLVPEYEAALREIGWRGTSFEMVNKQNQTAYHLVFGTRSPKGMEAIKRAMRRASPTGEFRYTDRVDPAQPILLGMSASEGYPLEIADYLYLNYKGREVSKQHIIDDVITWHRRWLEHPHLTAALRLLEDDTPSRISNVAVYATAFARSASGRASSML